MAASSISGLVITGGRVTGDGGGGVNTEGDLAIFDSTILSNESTTGHGGGIAKGGGDLFLPTSP